MSGDDAQLNQQARAARDAYTAGRNLTVNNYLPAGEKPSAPKRIWGSVPARNPGFTGREELLAAVRDALVAGDRAVVQALHGMGGVGKTQIAIEYAHRFADDYDLVWWVNTENATLIGEQFTALAADLGCVDQGAPVDAVRRAVAATLHGRERWLLIFDNAEVPEAVALWLPGGDGHVLITSRSLGWDEVAVPVEVGVLARTESVKILRRRVRALSEADADAVAGAAGDLALAVAQAAGYMAETGMPAREYVGLLRDRAAEILSQGRPASYPRPLAAVTQLAYDRLRREDPAAADVAAICAFLAPEPVPSDWFVGAAEVLPVPLAERMADPIARGQLLSLLGRSAVVRVDPGGLVMHRLTQAILRSHLPPGSAAAIRGVAEAVVAASDPGDPELPGAWPGWARVLPHLLALDPAASDSTALWNTAGGAAWYLVRRDDARVAHDLALDLYERLRDRLGPDDGYTLRAANTLAYALRHMGRYIRARELDEDTLARRRILHGEDHPQTLTSAGNLARDLSALGECGAARELEEDVLARRRRVLGEDHPSTLGSGINLALDRRRLGEYGAARELDEDVLVRRRRVLGEDHPDTLASASSLASDLYWLGDYRAARELDEDTLARQRRVLGEDHPDTQQSVRNLAEDLRALGET